MLKDYDMSVLYHPGKANVVADAISRMNTGSVSHLDVAKKDLEREVYRLYIFGMRLEISPDGGTIVHHNSELSLVVKVKSKQHLDLALMDLKALVRGKMNELFSREGDGVLKYQREIMCSQCRWV